MNFFPNMSDGRMQFHTHCFQYSFFLEFVGIKKRKKNERKKVQWPQSKDACTKRIATFQFYTMRK